MKTTNGDKAKAVTLEKLQKLWLLLGVQLLQYRVNSYEAKAEI